MFKIIGAKAYLSEIRRLDAVIDAKLAERDALYEMLTHITPTLKQDVVSSGGFQQDKMGNAIAKVTDLGNELDSVIDSFVDKKREASALLEQLDNPLHYQVLHKRYVLFHSFEKIAGDLNYSYRHVCFMHGRALQAFDAVLRQRKEEGA